MIEYNTTILDETLKRKVREILGSNWGISLRTVIDNIDENGFVNGELFVGNIKKPAEEYGQKFSIDYKSDLPLGSQIALFVGQLKDYRDKFPVVVPEI